MSQDPVARRPVRIPEDDPAQESASDQYPDQTSAQVPVREPADQSEELPADQSVEQPANQPVGQVLDQPAKQPSRRRFSDFSLEPTNSYGVDPETLDERSDPNDRVAFYESQRPPHYGE